MDLDAFSKWLTKEGYRPRTVQKTVTDLKSLKNHPDLAKNPTSDQRARDYLRAYTYYSEFLGEKPRGLVEPTIPERTSRRRRHHDDGPKKLAKVGIDAGGWKRMWKLLDADESPEGHALAVLMATGLRVSDLLRVTPMALDVAFRRSDGQILLEVKGGKDMVSTVDAARAEWTDLREAMAEAGRPENVAAFISPGSANPDAGGAAYRQLVRRLRSIADEAGVSGPIHLHRLRRSVAELALESGASLEEVQMMLGHTDIKTTQIYTAGARAKLAAKGLSKIRR